MRLPVAGLVTWVEALIASSSIKSCVDAGARILMIRTSLLKLSRVAYSQWRPRPTCDMEFAGSDVDSDDEEGDLVDSIDYNV